MIEALAGLGLAFWGILALGYIVTMALTDDERYGLTTGSVILTVAALLWVTDNLSPDILPVLLAQLTNILIGVAVYLVVGVAWGIARWWFFLADIREKLVEYRAKHDITGPLSDEQKSRFISSLRSGSGYNDYGYGASTSVPPLIRESKARLSFWMIYWPFSAPWTLINKPVKMFFTMVYNRLAGFLQGMSDKMFADVA